MSRTLQFKRYANTTVATTTGANGELIIDLTNQTLTVHNGTKVGGTRLATETYVANTINAVAILANSDLVLTQSAYNQTNAAYTLAQSAFILANTTTGNTTANIAIGAFTQANAVNVLTYSAYAYANTVNTYTYSAYAYANTVNTYTYSAYAYANSINVTIQSAFTQANVANTLANTGGTIGGNTSIKGYLSANNGLYSSNNYTGSYSDGIIVDYVTGNGRISVGSGDNITFYTGGPATTPVANLYSNATFSTTNVISSGLITTTGNGVGYATGSGGVITQSTNRTTGVTLNKPTGQITLFSQAMANTTSNTFIFTNSTITANDFLLINHWSGGTLGNYTFASNTSAGQANVTIKAINTVTAEAPVLQYVVIKGAAS